MARKCDLDFDPGNFISSGGKLRKVEARRRSGEEDGMQMYWIAKALSRYPICM
jgi:hypothetical protein